MTTETIKFRLGKNPLIKEKIIILEETDGRKAVIFPQYRQKHEIEHAEVAKSGEVLELTGKWGTDKKTGSPQFFIDKAHNASYQEELNDRQPVVIPGDISPSVQVEDKSDTIQFWDRFEIELNMAIHAGLDKYKPNANEYPAPLFDGDPYAIDPSRDFLENIKTYQIGNLIFYTDGIMYWLKDHKTLRNKVFITSSVQEQFNNIDNPFEAFATH